MLCRNHPGVTATGQCAECGKSFCAHCLVLVRGRDYCATCKMRLAPGGMPPPPARSGPVVAEARNALLLAMVGLFCCALLQPMALGQAAEARRLLAADPSLEGEGMATAARIIAIAGMILWGLAIVSRLILRSHA